MTVSTAKGSCSTRTLICSCVISSAFIATLLAGVHLQTITVSDKLSSFVIPIYRGALGKSELNRSEQNDPDTVQIRRGVTAATTAGRLILESECDQRQVKTAGVKITNESETASDGGLNTRENYAGFFQDRVNVAIVAAMRTGSSFVGEMLGRRPDFFYLFEPGLRLQHIFKLKNFTEAVMMTKYLEMLDGMYRCNYTNLNYFVKYTTSLHYEMQLKHIPGLMDPRTCIFHRKDRNNKTRRYCVPITQTAAEARCKKKKKIGVKMIRIHDINLLLPLILDKQVKLRVIHLVRDPRGMVTSRLMLYYNKHSGVYTSRYMGTPMRAIVEEYCSTWWKNVEIGRYVKEIRNSYMLLRYEDAAMNPFGTARKIYSFLGLGEDIPKSITKWLLNSTMRTYPKSSPYSTQRDSRATSEQWRSKLTYEMIKKIENTGVCRELMKAMGYGSVYEESNLNKSGISYVEKLPTFSSKKYDNYFSYS